MLLTASQIIIKTRLNAHGPIPLAGTELLRYLAAATVDVRLVGGFAMLAVAAFAWYAGLSRVPLSAAFPIAALAYPLVFLAAIAFLREEFSWTGFAGSALIVSGVILIHSGR